MSSNRGRPRLSYREYHQVRLMDGGIQPDIVAGVDLEAVGIFMGGGLGRAEHPGLGWRRLRWAALRPTDRGPDRARWAVALLPLFSCG